MSEYPLSSAPEGRFCGVFEPAGVCPTYPCIHTACHDPDFLIDVEESLQDLEFHLRALRAYESLSRPNSRFRKSLTPPEEWAKYEAKFDRYRRLDEKSEMRDKEFREYAKWERKRWAEIDTTTDQRYCEHDECCREEGRPVVVCLYSEEGRQYLTSQGRTLKGQAKL